jgi:MOSC domain-containing protein YiiM
VKLLCVSVSKPKEVPYRDGTLTTGIYKEPINERVMLRSLNLEGDGQADLNAHGGTYKAVYAYPHEHYATWADELGWDDFIYGQFGENFTVEGMLETDVHVGDIYRIGEATVQVTQPRVPCFKLAHKMGIPTFVKTFMKANRSGFYLRVLEEGEVGAGDDIELIKADSIAMSVAEINYLLYFDNTNVENAKRALQIDGMAPGWIGSFEAIVQKAP